MKKDVKEFNKIQKFESIREMMELAEKQAGDKIAFEFRNEKKQRKYNKNYIQRISKWYKLLRNSIIHNKYAKKSYCNNWRKQL